MDDYWELLPRYQGKEVADLKFLRILYGTYDFSSGRFYESIHQLVNTVEHSRAV